MTTQILEAIRKGEVFNAHRAYGKKFFFSTEDLEFGFIMFMGYASHGGGTVGEMLHIARMVEEDKPESWVQETSAMADRTEARARQSLANGHTISAREALLRATFYHRISTAMLSPRKQTEQWEAHFIKSRNLFKEAAVLFSPQIETVEIPFEDTVLPGYFVKAAEDSTPRKTLLMIGGGETFAEDLYFYIAPPALARGYNFMTVDLPGQGGLPLEGHFFRPDMETPMKPVIDYLYNRPDVDTERLAAYGISGGGYYVPRAAAYEKRIKAIIANSLLSDLNRIFKSSLLQFGELFKKHDPMTYYITDMIAWRTGVNNPLELIPSSKDFKVDPGLIDCPALIVIGEGEYEGSKEVQRQQNNGLEAFQHPNKKLVITPMNEGGGNHILGENLPLMSQVVFDWLDEVFE